MTERTAEPTSRPASPLVAAIVPTPAPLTPPLYWRFLRLHHVRPSGWQRAILVEGVVALAIVLVLADVASAWTLLLLPLGSFAVVKAHDVLAGWLPNGQPRQPLPPPKLMDYVPFVVPIVVVVLLRLTVHGRAEGLLVLLAYGIDVVWSMLVYRYLIRRGADQSTAIGIGVVGLVLSPLAAMLGAAIWARRQREA